MKKLIFYILIVFLFQSCTKDESKTPVQLAFKIDIERESSSNSYLSFSGGEINLADFTFNGTRVGADDVAFEKEFSNGNLISFSSEEIVPQLDFEIPKGQYSFTTVTFETFDDNDNVTIKVQGEFNDGVSVRPVLFEFLSGEYFSITNSLETQISENDNNISLIKLDPFFWFSTTTSSQLKNADTKIIYGIETIFISEDFNEELYDKIADRIDKSLEIEFGNN